MAQENLSDRSESQACEARPTPGNSRLAGRLLLAASLIGLFAVVFAATHFPAIRSAWAGLVNEPQTLTRGPDSSVRKTAVAAPLENGSAAGVTQQSVALTAEEQVQKIWSEFEKAAPGTALDAWTKQHPEIPCHRFNGTMWSPTADAAWLERCSPGTQPEDAHWFFYAFGLDDPPTARLEQFDVSTASLPMESLTAVHGMLQSRLAERFGPGEDTSPKIGHPRDPVPPPNYRWQASEVEVQLFESELDPRNNFGRLRLQVRGRLLIEALKEDEHLKQFWGASFPYQAGTGTDMQLSEKLKGEFPGPSQMLLKERPDADPQKVAQALEQWKQQFRASQAAGQTGVRAAVIAIPQSTWNAAEFEDSIVRLLTAAKSASPEHQPVLLLSADRLAGRLPQVVQNDKSETGRWGEWRSQLEKLGVTFDQSGQDLGGQSWIYTGNLLKRVAADYSQSEWGEHAFALLLAQGFEMGADCAVGTDQFRKVIPQGLQFLEKHPNSPYRLDVQIAVAQAYETWWSLSQAPARSESEEDSTVEAEKYQEGGAGARQKAIEGYQALLQSAPQSDQAFYARRQLPRLKLGADTGQRRFYCEVGD